MVSEKRNNTFTSIFFITLNTKHHFNNKQAYLSLHKVKLSSTRVQHCVEILKVRKLASEYISNMSLGKGNNELFNMWFTNFTRNKLKTINLKCQWILQLLQHSDLELFN